MELMCVRRSSLAHRAHSHILASFSNCECVLSKTWTDLCCCCLNGLADAHVSRTRLFGSACLSCTLGPFLSQSGPLSMQVAVLRRFSHVSHVSPVVTKGRCGERLGCQLQGRSHCSSHYENSVWKTGSVDVTLLQRCRKHG